MLYYNVNVCCSFAEVSVSLLFVLLVFLWFARNPGFVAGYASLFKKKFVTSLFPEEYSDQYFANVCCVLH